MTRIVTKMTKVMSPKMDKLILLRGPKTTLGSKDDSSKKQQTKASSSKRNERRNPTQMKTQTQTKTPMANTLHLEQ